MTQMDRFISSVKDLYVFDQFSISPDYDTCVFWARTQAGWCLDDRGWYAPDGTPEADWKGATPEETLFELL